MLAFHGRWETNEFFSLALNKIPPIFHHWPRCVAVIPFPHAPCWIPAWEPSDPLLSTVKMQLIPSSFPFHSLCLLGHSQHQKENETEWKKLFCSLPAQLEPRSAGSLPAKSSFGRPPAHFVGAWGSRGSAEWLNFWEMPHTTQRLQLCEQTGLMGTGRAYSWLEKNPKKSVQKVWTYIFL